MIKPTKHGKTFRVRVQRSDRRWQRITTGTTDRRTAVNIATMVSALIAQRDWSILDAVCANEIALGPVWDAYRDDPQLTEFRATLNDVDLDHWWTNGRRIFTRAAL